MSENPNPTRCGQCGELNPPGAEVCQSCQAPLTLSASAAEIDSTPESQDELRRYAASGDEGAPEAGRTVGLSGAAYQMPNETLDQDPTERRRN